ncbi:hypothetical protein [Bittarella massiliensis (ex Durand et al. 2017)]|uniref:hypothetical protein n=1 Tax=Bittarella massiliensis (ex Durand et al. 2017) TaxID=1720313 RepID=UPI001AA1065F|nr:hypothetical protein [Bittarella massiliensis (ex Durand et al. 2017)]MBO1680590.1 hypothetical protein [Bittarella massiliensis (ex Durand et al. 2017)]
MDFSREELTEAKRQIESTLHKLRETVKTLTAKEHPERYRSQLTLATRRVLPVWPAKTTAQVVKTPPSKKGPFPP